MWAYIHCQSPIHRISGHTKLLALLFWSMTVFLIPQNTLVFPIIFVILQLVIARLPFKKILISVLPFFILMTVTLIFSAINFPPAESPWNPEGFNSGLIYMLRFSCSLLFALLLIQSTRQSELIKGIEQLLRPVPFIDQHQAALSVMMTINFLPIILHQWKQLDQAQKVRMVPNGWPVIGKVKLLVPMLIHLFLSAENLGKALEARGVLIQSDMDKAIDTSSRSNEQLRRDRIYTAFNFGLLVVLLIRAFFF